MTGAERNSEFCFFEFGWMSCDHELANEWARCSGKSASYITNKLIDDSVFDEFPEISDHFPKISEDLSRLF